MPSETQPPLDTGDIDLGIATDKVCHIVVKARAWDAKQADDDPDSGSNATDDGMADVLEDDRNDATLAELLAFIRALDFEEQINLLGLPMLGDYLEEGLAVFNRSCEDFNARI